MATYADGYYWHLQDGEEPEVVEVFNGTAYQTGSDVSRGLPGHPTDASGWPTPLEGRLVGPLTPPDD